MTEFSWFLGVVCMVMCLFVVAPVCCGQAAGVECVKSCGTFYSREMTEKAKANAEAYPWAAAMQEEIVERAKPWLAMPDDDLWGLMFGPHISRSWMVWSDGFCPACKKDVKMYTWEMDPWTIPWKVRCPHCKQLFPTNDFEAFHRSGYDEHGVFYPDRADRSLLFNAEHPDPDDPLHMFGVDDGEGYVDDEGHRWRFIGCYLIYGQWKKWIVDGIVSLSNAYLVSGDPVYARKAAILLDRAADVFPTFDFTKQGLVYETRQSVRGQVSTWHDACHEMNLIIMAYDRIFEAARDQEAELVAFLAPKAQAYKLDNPKSSWADIQRNIENNIFRNTLAHRSRIESNYPTTDQAIMAIKTVLDWPANRDEVLGLLDNIINKATAVDGMSGEKGLAGYTTIAPRSVALILAQYSRLDPGFLKEVYDRHPLLHKMFRFHIDTWCLGRYYPQIGDSGGFGKECPSYAGASFNKNPGAEPSIYALFLDLYELTGDAAFVQVLYGANDRSLDELPHDLFADDPAEFQAKVKEVIDEVGADISVPSINKEQWRLALLRSGTGEDRRAFWIDYDAGERHSHADGMNIGLFAKGLDLIPEFGYPPVGYGGWGAPKAVWYTMTAAHNTVVVDGGNQNRVNSGVTQLWADGNRFRAIRVSDPALIKGKQYQRTVVMVDLDDADSYIIDHFVVEGGKDHAKFFRSSFGAVETAGVTLTDAPEFGHGTQMRNFRRDENPAPGWSVDWAIEDRYGYLPKPRNIHLRYTDLTDGASAWLAESWIDTGQFGGDGDTFIPTVITRRTTDAEEPLRSSFLAVIEPYENDSKTEGIRRLPLDNDGIAVEIQRKDGRLDLCVLPGVENGYEAVEPAHDVHVAGALALITFTSNEPGRLFLCQGSKLEVDGIVLEMAQADAFVELVLTADDATVVAGNAEAVKSLTRKGRKVSF